MHICGRFGRIKYILFLSIILLLMAIPASLCLGAAKYTPAELIGNMDILRYVRVPRVLAAVFAGAGLAGTGVIIQTLLGNSLAGAAVSFAGLIGFVGLIVPHAARLVAGEENAQPQRIGHIGINPTNSVGNPLGY